MRLLPSSLQSVEVRGWRRLALPALGLLLQAGAHVMLALLVPA